MQELDALKIKNAELRQKLETRRLETVTNWGYLVNILAIATQKWDVMILYFFAFELVGVFMWMCWVAFWESRKS